MGKVDRFLAGRSDRAFLEFYLQRHPQILERVSSPGLFLYAVSEVDLALRLFEFRLLPEQHRKKFVQKVTQYTVKGQDSYVFESREIRKMFTQGEMTDLKLRLRTELVPNLAIARDNWEDNFPSDEDPESYIQPFEEILSALRKEFADDPDVTKAVSKEKELVKRWVEATLSDIAERDGDRGYSEPEYDSGEYPRAEADTALAERSIFDDIDL
jgi:hypothetical protein